MHVIRLTRQRTHPSSSVRTLKIKVKILQKVSCYDIFPHFISNNGPDFLLTLVLHLPVSIFFIVFLRNTTPTKVLDLDIPYYIKRNDLTFYNKPLLYSNDLTIKPFS